MLNGTFTFWVGFSGVILLALFALGVLKVPVPAHPRKTPKAMLVVCLGFVICWCLFLTVAGSYMIWLSGDYVAPLRAMQPEAIESIEIAPSYYVNTLVEERVLLTDREQIRRIVQAVTTAEPFSPNHPRGLWTCVLRFRGRQQDLACAIYCTSNMGTLIFVNSNVEQGWHLADFRADELKELLESAALSMQGKQPAKGTER